MTPPDDGVPSGLILKETQKAVICPNRTDNGFFILDLNWAIQILVYMENR